MKDEQNRLLSEKFDYIINTYIKSASDITRAFGFKTNTMISNLRNPRHISSLTKLHIDGLEKYFDIPVEVWDSLEIDEVKIARQIKNYKKEKEFKEKHAEKIDNIFQENQKLFKHLVGIWYAYIYPSNPASATDGIWTVETTIHDDYSVVDWWGNRGYLKIGKHESLIIKESYENDDLTVIRFPNRQVRSQNFRFVIISNQNFTQHEMVNFGFYSRIKYSPEEAKEILGEMNTVQMKLNLDFNDRLIQRAIVPQ